MVEDGPGMLDDDVRAALKMAACDLSLKKWDQMHIVNDVCDGLIKTAWDSHVVGARSGILFRAQVATEAGDYRVNFLLSEDDLKRGADIIREFEERGAGVWGKSGSPFPCPALYEFYDLTDRRKLN